MSVSPTAVRRCWPVLVWPDGAVTEVVCEDGERGAVDSYEWYW